LSGFRDICTQNEPGWRTGRYFGARV
jgi:hypothetical protein